MRIRDAARWCRRRHCLQGLDKKTIKTNSGSAVAKRSEAGSLDALRHTTLHSFLTWFKERVERELMRLNNPEVSAAASQQAEFLPALIPSSTSPRPEQQTFFRQVASFFENPRPVFAIAGRGKSEPN